MDLLAMTFIVCITQHLKETLILQPSLSLISLFFFML